MEGTGMRLGTPGIMGRSSERHGAARRDPRDPGSGLPELRIPQDQVDALSAQGERLSATLVSLT